MMEQDHAQLTEPSYQVMEQAAEWFALLRSGEATAAQQLAWQQWLQASVEHQRAWFYVERIGQRFEPIQVSPVRSAAVSAFCQVQNQQARRRQVLRGLLVLSGSSLLGWAGWQQTTQFRLPMADYHTATGEIRMLALQDGTHVWLNALSAVNEQYQPHQRQLTLVSGEMLVQTAPDPSRQFIVTTPYGQLRALGTRFSVRLEDHHVLVAVYDGAVEIQTAWHGTTQIIPAGSQARFTDERIFSAEPADPAREAWSRGILIAQDIPLTELITELRRYYSGHLSLSPDAAELRVFGSYPVTDIEQTLSMLESVLPIQIQVPFPGWKRIRLKRST
ncbi:Fe2+-dicitrate sensor, membrane component [Nitrincola lacisaponensis]|uniref:Fe2+-dicitrate sensor, membrane component n=2 Tax=Nitrincola lacisaponensis TaxID=267850 RepID=A0A063XXE3_9GAMM|nr:Fe2+-dicitrate sensor, membrane component [Nitrincola lacisaponensis]